MTEMDVEKNIAKFLAARQADDRNASFDYCFNHFQSHREQGRLEDLLRGEALQLSCLHLGFYLASWGMLRGSTELHKRSVKTFVHAVEALVAAPAGLWALDAERYDGTAISEILDFGTQLGRSLHEGATDTLVTKVMLGTMGCVPAFDTNFMRGFQCWEFGPKELQRIGQFYRDNSAVIEAHRVPTLDFDRGTATNRRYTQAKVIDMIFFIEGEQLSP